MLACLLCARILNPVGQGNYIPFYTEREELDSSLRNNSRSIIIYEPGRYLMPFIDFGVYRFSDRVSFAGALDKLAPKTCTRFPCFIGYAGEHQLELPQPLFSLAKFAAWCEDVADWGHHVIRSDSELRDLIRSGKEFAMSVEETKPEPENLFVNVDPEVLRTIKIPISNGTWVYKPEVRMFIPYNERESVIPLVTNFAQINQSKKLVTGCVLEKNVGKIGDEFVNVIVKLWKKLGNEIEYVVVNTEQWKEHARHFNLSKLTAPYFFALKFDDDQKPSRFFIQGENASHWDYVDAFVERVRSGEEPQRNISAVFAGEGPEVKFRQVGSEGIEEKLLSRDRVALLVLTASWCVHCRHFKPLLNVTAQFLANSYPNIDFFWIDGPKNDLPHVIPDFRGYPTLFMWPAGEKYQSPVSYEGGREFERLLTWIGSHSGLENFKIPEYDMEDIKELIREAKRNVV